MSFLPADLVAQVWTHLVVWRIDFDVRKRMDMSTRWWPYWRQRYDQVALHALWDPCAMPRKLISRNVGSQCYAQWGEWWQAQAQRPRWKTLPRAQDVPLSRVSRGQVVLCRVGRAMWVGEVRGIVCCVTKAGKIRKVSAGGWSLVQVDDAEPKWWSGVRVRSCEWMAIPYASPCSK